MTLYHVKKIKRLKMLSFLISHLVLYNSDTVMSPLLPEVG